MANGPVHDWLRSVDATSTWTTSVCTGSLVLAATGLLTGRRATSHWIALEHLGEARSYIPCGGHRGQSGRSGATSRLTDPDTYESAGRGGSTACGLSPTRP